MFEDEVDYAIGKGWSPEVVFSIEADVDALAQHYRPGNQVVMWRAPAEKSGGGGADDDSATEGKVFKTLWFDDDLDGKIKNSQSTVVRAAMRARCTTSTTRTTEEDNANIEMIWEHLTDSNGDLTAGDLGKVDLVSAADDGDTEDVDETNEAGNPDGRADNYETRTEASGSGDDLVRASRSPVDGAADFYKCTEDDGGDDDDGTICDAVWTRDAEVKFADGTFGCSTTRTVSITCTWDADGGMADGPEPSPGHVEYNLMPVTTTSTRTSSSATAK